MRRKLRLIIVILCSSFSLKAQVLPSLDSLHDYCYICQKNEHQIIKPPYTKRFVKELPFIVTSGLTFAGGFIAAVVDKTPNFTTEQIENGELNISSINSIDRSSALNNSKSSAKASDYVLFSIVLLPAAFLSENHTSRDITTLLVMYAEVFTFNYGLTEIAKNTVNRARPFTYNPEVNNDLKVTTEARKSFYSGHTSQTAAATFFFAKVITDYHPTIRTGVKWGVWIFAASIPAVNGYLRVKAGKHFPTDVITGYVAGAATGILIPELHRTRKSKEVKEKLGIGLLPTKGGMRMDLSYRF